MVAGIPNFTLTWDLGGPAEESVDIPWIGVTSYETPNYTAEISEADGITTVRQITVPDPKSGIIKLVIDEIVDKSIIDNIQSKYLSSVYNNLSLTFNDNDGNSWEVVWDTNGFISNSSLTLADPADDPFYSLELNLRVEKIL